MKKVFRTLFAAALICMFTSAAAFAFEDISDQKQSEAAETLYTLGIMDGYSDGSFKPENNLTRGQFAKLATLIAGFNQQQSYKNYTIFPDVKSEQWEAPYVNAAVRKYGMLQGFPDGTFRPEENVTFGQAVTVLINLLGYKTEDVGVMWPQDYIAKAAEIGLSDGLELDAEQALKRGEAAILLKNLLLCEGKGGTVFLNTVYSSTASNMMLIKTSQTDSELSALKAVFYDGSTIKTLSVSKDIPLSLIGTRGYVIYRDKTTTVSGFIPEDEITAEGEVIRTYPNKIQLNCGEYIIPEGTMMNLNGEIYKYEEYRFDLTAGKTVNLFFDKTGNVEMISSNEIMSLSETVIYGLSNSRLMSGVPIYKNGIRITESGIEKYDVVSYDSNKNVYYVSDAKYKGYIEWAKPYASAPVSLKVFGNVFSVKDSVSGYFADMKTDDEIVLLLDVKGDVAGVLKASDFHYEQIGILKSYSSAKAEVELLNGYTVSGTPNLSITGESSKNSTYINQLVEVNQRTGGNISLRQVSYTTEKIPNWDTNSASIGNYRISNSVKIYEQYKEGYPLVRVDISDIENKIIPSSDIRYVKSDNAGIAQIIVINAISADAFDYGVCRVVRTENDIADVVSRTFDVKLLKDGEELSYSVRSFPTYSKFHTKPVAIQKGLDKMGYVQTFYVDLLISAGTVDRDCFSLVDGVKIDGQWVEMIDDIGFYARDSKEYVSYEQAMETYDEYEVYLNDTLENGGKCVLVYVY